MVVLGADRGSSGPSTTPSTAPSLLASKAIADLQAENKKLKDEIASLKRELALLKEKLGQPGGGGKITQGMTKAQIANTLESDGWKMQDERVDNIHRTADQEWTKVSGEWVLRKEIHLLEKGGQYIYGGISTDSKSRANP